MSSTNYAFLRKMMMYERYFSNKYTVLNKNIRLLKLVFFQSSYFFSKVVILLFLDFIICIDAMASIDVEVRAYRGFVDENAKTDLAEKGVHWAMLSIADREYFEKNFENAYRRYKTLAMRGDIKASRRVIKMLKNKYIYDGDRRFLEDTYLRLFKRYPKMYYRDIAIFYLDMGDACEKTCQSSYSSIKKEFSRYGKEYRIYSQVVDSNIKKLKYRDSYFLCRKILHNFELCYFEMLEAYLGSNGLVGEDFFRLIASRYELGQLPKDNYRKILIAAKKNDNENRYEATVVSYLYQLDPARYGKSYLSRNPSLWNQVCEDLNCFDDKNILYEVGRLVVSRFDDLMLSSIYFEGDESLRSVRASIKNESFYEYDGANLQYALDGLLFLSRQGFIEGYKKLSDVFCRGDGVEPNAIYCVSFKFVYCSLSNVVGDSEFCNEDSTVGTLASNDFGFSKIIADHEISRYYDLSLERSEFNE